MRRALTLLLAVLATGSLICGQTRNDKNARDAKAIQELRKLVQAWDQADVTGDTTTLDRLLADEFSFVAGDRKAQYLASLKSRPSDSIVESAVSTDVQVQVYGTTAIVTGLDTITGKTRENRIQTAGSIWMCGLRGQGDGSVLRLTQVWPIRSDAGTGCRFICPVLTLDSKSHGSLTSQRIRILFRRRTRRRNG